MTKQQRLRHLASTIHKEEDCEVCRGTGIDPRARKPRNACARCFVRGTMVMIAPRDLRWLLEQAGHK